MRRRKHLQVLPVLVIIFVRNIRNVRCFSTLTSDVRLATSKPGLDPSQSKFHCPVVYHEGYSISWPEKHTFPMTKFYWTADAILHQCQRNDPSSALSRPLVQSKEDFFRPLETLPTDWICVLNKEFYEKFCRGELSAEEERQIGFREHTKRPELIQRTLLEVAGTILTAQLAVRHGVAANLAGGTHHAADTHGAGFTIVNDVAVATHVLTTVDQSVQRVLVEKSVFSGNGVQYLWLCSSKE